MKRAAFSRKIEEAIKRLEDATYAEIRRLIEGRGSAESISELTGFLRQVQQLRAVSSPDVSARRTDSGKQIDLPVSQGPESPELSATPEFLVRRGKRQNGTDFYEQRVSWETVRRFVELIDMKFGNRSFHPSSLFRELDIPAYQGYAILRFLTAQGHVESPRRGTYRRLRGVPLLGVLGTLKNSLPPSGPTSSEAMIEAEMDRDTEARNETA